MIEIIIIIIAAMAAVFMGVIIYRKKFSVSKIIEDGKKLIRSNKPNDALLLFKKLAKKKKIEDPNINFFLGESYYKLEKYDWALAEFKKVESFPKSHYKYFKERELYEKIADLYLRFGKMTEAQKALLVILEIAPEDYQTYVKVGNIFFDRGLYDNAITYYQKALSINSSSAEALFKCGEVYFHKKEFPKSLGYLQGAIKNKAGLVKANYYMGLIYKSTRNFAKAVTELEIGSQQKEIRANALLQKGIILVEIGDRGRAVESLERALKTAEEQKIKEDSPMFLSIRYNLANCYEMDKNIIPALDQWEKINSLNPNYQDVSNKLKIYSDLRVDDNLKDFLTSTSIKFESYCNQIIEHLGLKVIETHRDSKKDIFEVVVSESEGDWLKARTTRKLAQFYRQSDPISENSFRLALDKMKEHNASELMLFSSSEFSKVAIDYSETRPIKLFNRDELSKLLKTINIR